ARATLASELYRITGLLCVFGVFALIVISSWLAQPDREHTVRYGVYLCFWLCCLLYETVVLLVARRYARHGLAVPTRVWIINTIVECSIPTLALWGLSADVHYLGPYRALNSSVVMIYPLFIILSTLRLRPALCVLAGLVSGAGYTAVYLRTLE